MRMKSAFCYKWLRFSILSIVLSLGISSCRQYSYSVHFTLVEDVCSGAPMSDEVPTRDVSTANMRFYLYLNGDESIVRTNDQGVITLDRLSKGDSLLFFLPERRETDVEENDDLCERFQTTPDFTVVLQQKNTPTDSASLHKPCNPCLFEEPTGPPPIPQN